MSSTFTCIHTHSLTNILGRLGSKYSQEGWPRPDLTPPKIRMGGCLMSALDGGNHITALNMIFNVTSNVDYAML